MNPIIQTALFLFLALQASLPAFSQSVKDIEGNEYPTLEYGHQQWMASNLNVAHFRNGDTIPQAHSEEEWKKAGQKGKPAWCYYDNNPENGPKYGKLYNWYALTDPRKLAPEGWHIPETQDWRTLVKNLLGVDVAGVKLKSKSGWKTSNGSNKIGFNALPAGTRNGKAAFKGMDTQAQWWTTSEPLDVQKSDLIYSFMLNDQTMEVSYLKTEKQTGLSVRCIKDKAKP